MTDADTDVFRIGSLFTGVGGLDLGIERALVPARVLWQVELDPWRRDVLATRWPEAKRFEDVKAVGARELEVVDVIIGGFPCFPAGTLVETEQGLRAIETIAVGDRVLTHARRFRRVRATGRKENAPLLQVTAQGSPPLAVTPEHPFYARASRLVWNKAKRGYKRVWEAPCWVAAKDLRPGVHYLSQIVDAEAPTPPYRGKRAFWYLVGRWLGDGWLVEHLRKSRIPAGRRGSRVASMCRKAIICCAHSETTDLKKRIAAAGFHATPAVEKSVVKFHISSAALVEKLRPFGQYAHGKALPAWVFALPRDARLALWRGYVDADGSVRTAQTRVSTVSEALAHGMARLVRSCFRRAASVVRSSLRTRAMIEGRTCAQRPVFETTLCQQNREAFVEEGLCWVPCRKVSNSAERAAVFNLEVEEDESYVASSFIVHNCTGISAAGKGKGLKDPRSGLWKEYARIVEELLPPVVIIENSPLLRSRGLEVVLEDLAARGYDAEWDCVPAQSLGAPHRRDRIFIVAWQRAGAAHADRVLRLVEQRLTGRRARLLRDSEEAVAVDGGALGPAPDAASARREGEGRDERGSAPRATTPSSTEPGPRRLGARGDAPDADGEPIHMAGCAVLLPDAARLGAAGGAADADAQRRDERSGPRRDDGGLVESAHSGSDGRAPSASADADAPRLEGHGAESARTKLGDAERRRPRGHVARALRFFRGGRDRYLELAAARGFSGSAVAGVRRVDDGLPTGAHGSPEPRPVLREARVELVGESGTSGAQPASAPARTAAEEIESIERIASVTAQHFSEVEVFAHVGTIDEDATWPTPGASWPAQEAWPVRVLEDGERRPREDNKRLAALGDAVVVPVAEHIARIARVALLILYRELRT